MLAELTHDEDTNSLQVIMAAREVELVCQQFLNCLGNSESWEPETFDEIVSVMPVFKFSIFLALIESKYAKEIDSCTLDEAVKDLHDYFLLDVIKKGKLKKKMEIFPAFKEFWVVVQPHKITVYSSHSEKEARGEILINPQSRIEKLEAPQSLLPTRHAKHRFALHCENKHFEFQATDHRSRLQWISAIEKAIDFSFQGSRLQLSLAEERRGQREEDIRGRVSTQDIVEQTKAELEMEKAARIQAEREALLLSQEKESEEKRMKELENIREELERLLEEEKQAKRDEEIVRTLQARMLTEEWERREQLEKIQAEQSQMLEEERSKRAEFEKLKEERERMATEAEIRLREMESEKQRLDEELKKHRDRTRRVNIGQEVLEAKMKVHKQESELKRNYSMRLSSFHPSTLTVQEEDSDDKPKYRPLRSASMRETSYSRSIRRRFRNEGKPMPLAQQPSTAAVEVNNNE